MNGNDPRRWERETYAVAAPQTDLARAFAALSAKRSRIDRLFAYYDGEQPLRYSTACLQQAFARIDAKFSENWCATVVDSLVDRLALTGFALRTDQAAQDVLDTIWQQEHLEIETDDVAEDVAVCGESFVIVGRDEDGLTRVVHNDPRVCTVAYDKSNPRAPAFAAKWYDEGGQRHLTLYYTDRLEHYVSRGATEQVQSASGFTLEDEQANDTGRIPVFHVRSRVRRIYGELQNATEPQDAVNKLIADMMVAAEFGAFKQRYIISQADVSQLRNAPNEIWSIPAGDGDGSESTQVGEFSATELANFTQAVDHWANAMARITRTPAHYFFAQGGNISGDALVAMETPLARKAAKYQERLGACWRDVASYALALNGRDVPAHEIECVWEDVRTVQPAAEADVVGRLVAAGVPLKTALRRGGWTEGDLSMLDEDKAAESASQASLAQEMLNRARAQFDAGRTNPLAG